MYELLDEQVLKRIKLLEDESNKLREDSDKLREEGEKLREDSDKLREEGEKLREDNDKLREKIKDLETILPTRYLENVEKSSVKILDEAFAGVGVGFYISSTKVISCSHNFPNLKGLSLTEAKLLSFWCENFEGTRMGLRLLGFSDENDYDVVIFDGDQSSFFLSIGTPRQDMSRLAITSFGISIAKAIDNTAIISEHHTVIQATLFKISPHHIVYSSNLFSGDSGGAVICSANGEVIAIHQETVNEANEKLEDSDVTAHKLNASINSLVSGLSQGFIGLRLDSDIVVKLIANS